MMSLNLMRRVLRVFCVVFIVMQALSFAVALSDSTFEACGQSLRRAYCTGANTIMVVCGTAILAAVWFFVFLGKVRAP
jgi:preprotein translocase subunit SecY